MSTAPMPIALPVTAVTALEDRAHIERTAVLDLEAGVQRLRLGPVSALAADRTLHAELTADHPATVLDVRLVRTWTPVGPLPSADDSALRRRAHELEGERHAAEQRCDRLHARLDVLGRLAADLLRDIGEGAGSGESDGPRWALELDRVDGEREKFGEQLRSARARLASLDAELDEVRRAMTRSGAQPAELVGHVELTVDAAAAGPARLRLSHLTPCALWRPAYRAVLDGDCLTLETDAMVWQRTGEDWSGVRLTLSTARSALATDPPRLGEDRLTLGDRSAAERRTVDVELREEAIGDIGPVPVLGLPGVDDGGEARVLSAPAPVSVPGDGRAHRVPLSAFTAPAVSEYACSPELSALVTRVVRFDNGSGHALLAGPVDLVRAGGFGGRGTLDFTAPGAPVVLPFGSCDDHGVVREAEESRTTAGITQRTVVTRTVRLHLSRFSAPAERGERMIVVRERVPVSEVSAVEVRLLKDACSPAPAAVDADGVARWDVALPPGGRRTVTLVYELSASAKVAGL
ncbi:DUF4139 domain-containing protein [Streptomyces flavotricini]|uniref:DUF4139 domain-containing protein n=1 Tax=Streptomyces flavotricini TaxID=66888 RepID=A0ABS8DZS5_9ACTN|nr:DUF4139 domain-containing protein [Streptomyces flavotricini]MCC0094353.1 DUF4139 domain-containing protein [Streptomyces flavotricini]